MSRDELMSSFCERPTDVSLGDVMAQLQRIDARLDTLSMELYQVNAHVGRIA